MSDTPRKKTVKDKKFDELRGQKHPIKSKDVLDLQEALIKSNDIIKAQSQMHSRTKKNENNVLKSILHSNLIINTQKNIRTETDTEKAEKNKKTKKK